MNKQNFSEPHIHTHTLHMASLICTDSRLSQTNIISFISNPCTKTCPRHTDYTLEGGRSTKHTHNYYNRFTVVHFYTLMNLKCSSTSPNVLSVFPSPKLRISYLQSYIRSPRFPTSQNQHHHPHSRD